MPSVVLLGTLDTKFPEYEYVRERIAAAGCDVILVDAGARSEDRKGDISADEVAAVAGADRARLAASPDRGAVVTTMARGAAEIVRRLHADGRLDGILGLGGSGGSSIISAAMRALPLGVPKLLVSTMASGDTRSYVGTSDITLMHPVVDIAGINRVSELILANAAAAIAAMAVAARDFRPTAGTGKPLIGATMYGTTTPCVDMVRELLDGRGYEVLVFHANGTGGRAMESLIRAGLITGTLDITTAELSDEFVGGLMSAGPDRLEAAGSLGLPQVVSLGGLEQVCFGPLETLPEHLRRRPHYSHNPSVTLIRPDAEESVGIAASMARKLNAASGPLAVFIPLDGFSTYGAPGGPMHDPELDGVIVRELRAALRPDIDVTVMPTHINDPAFARAMAIRFDELYRTWDAARPHPSAGTAT